MNGPIDRLWNEMLDSEMNAEYFSIKGGHLIRCDVAARILLAITSSGVVAGWAIWNDSVEFPVLSVCWKVLSAIAAVISVSLPAFKISEKIDAASTMVAKYRFAQKEYESIWASRNELNEQEINLKIDKVLKIENELLPLEAKFLRKDKKLLEKIQNEIKTRRGIAQ